MRVSICKERMVLRMQQLHRTVENLHEKPHEHKADNRAVSHSLSYRQVLAILQPLISQRNT